MDLLTYRVKGPLLDTLPTSNYRVFCFQNSLFNTEVGGGLASFDCLAVFPKRI